MPDDPVVEARPLTLEEEAQFRESVKALGPVDDYGLAGTLHWSNRVAARLLATLDAERRKTALDTARDAVPEPSPCPTCNGDGWIAETVVDMGCCGQYLDSGECCAAIYGTANLVPEQRQEQAECPDCGGTGRVALAEPSLDVERLAVAINDAQIAAEELRLGRDLRVVASRIAQRYALAAPSKPDPTPGWDSTPMPRAER